MSQSADPITISVHRGGLMESMHLVDAVVVDARGEILRRHGDSDRAVYARSTIKPFQALPLFELDAAEHYQLSDAEIAIACASHDMSAASQEVAQGVLDKAGRTAADLRCGAFSCFYCDGLDGAPAERPTGGSLRNECSGKHAGFLAVCTLKGFELESYLDFAHPLQARIRSDLEEILQTGLPRGQSAIDGCSAPTYRTTPRMLATGYAQLGASAGPFARRAAIAERIVKACIAHPEMVAGPSRQSYKMMRALGGVFLKDGAEGMMAGLVPELGIGFCLKARDGGRRAAEVATGRLLQDLVPTKADALAPFAQPKMTNWMGAEVGEISAAF